MSVLKYFKNTPGRPPIGRQALSVIFFFKFATRSLAKKKGMSPTQRATPRGDRPLSPVGGGDRVPFALYKPWPPYAAIPFVI